MKVNAVQLPYPPMFQKEGKQKEIQTKYLMYLKNIGFYVYRDDRLIAKGLKLDLVTADYNYMVFRASIDLFSNSDDDVNLDVSKSQGILPDYGWNSLHERINPVIKMSKELWNIAGKKNSDPNMGKSEITHQRSNVLLSGTKPVIVYAEKGEIKPVQGIVKDKVIYC